MADRSGHMLNVLAITLSSSPGGTDRSLRSLALAFHGSDVSVTLGGPGRSNLESWWTGSGLPYLPLALPDRVGFTTSGGKRTNPLDLIRAGARTVGSVQTIRKAAAPFDVLHSNWLFTHVDTVLAGRLSKKPVIVELHDIVPPGPGRYILTEAASRASVSISVSDAVRRQLGRAAQGNAVTIHQGIDTAVFRPGAKDAALRAQLAQGDTSVTIAAVIGRLDPGKGVEYAIDAVAIANRDFGCDIHLAVLGAPAVDDGSYAESIRAHAQRVLPNKHTFLPPREDLVNILRSIDLLLAPSINEPFGLIVAEAQSVGVPAVVSDSGGLPEFVLDRETGYVVTAGDPLCIARAINNLLSDPISASLMSAAARDHMVSGFDIRRRAERVREQYWSVVSGEYRS